MKRKNEGSLNNDAPDLLEDDIDVTLDEATFEELELARYQNKVAEILRLKAPEEVIKKFKHKGLVEFLQYCPDITKENCAQKDSGACEFIHWKPVITENTDPSLGDCIKNGYCRNRKECKYIHYVLDDERASKLAREQSLQNSLDRKEHAPQMNIKTAYPSQWIEADLQHFDLSILGKFDVIMINSFCSNFMEITGKLKIDTLSDKGLLFVWTSSNRMEKVSEWINQWGYKIVNEIVYIRTTQLQRILRRKAPSSNANFSPLVDRCLVAFKGVPDVRSLTLNRQIDCDVIVAEPQILTQIPDEVYGIIERLNPGGRKLEIFGRTSNLRDGWITIGSYLKGSNIVDKDIQERYERYKNNKRK